MPPLDLPEGGSSGLPEQPRRTLQRARVGHIWPLGPPDANCPSATGARGQGRSPTGRWAGASSSSLKAVELPGPRAPWPLALMDQRTTHPGGGTPIPQERGVTEPSRTPAQASSGGQGSGVRETDTETAQGGRERKAPTRASEDLRPHAENQGFGKALPAVKMVAGIVSK